MLKSHLRLIVFCMFLIVLLLLNGFVYKFLNYNCMVLLVFLSLFLYRKIFGFEKSNNRFSKEIILNMSIILLLFLITYYLFGMSVGFVRTENFYSYYGFKEFIIPFIVFIVLKEFLRYQMVLKSGKSKKMLYLVCFLFVFFDTTNNINFSVFSNFRLFLNFILYNFIPVLVSNFVAMKIAKEFDYKCNVFWLVIFNLYSVLLPIVPNCGIYINSIIKLIIPVIIFIYSYFLLIDKPKGKVVNKKFNICVYILSFMFLYCLVYLTSGVFRYHAVAIGSGSMQPNIYKGDVVVIDKEYDLDKLKKGDIIAYKSNSVLIIHRIVDVEKVDNEYYIYTKGDANKKWDDLIIREDMIYGTVECTLPFIGYPTILLSEL